MLIRLGYEIAIECPQPTPVISVLEIHKDRQKEIKRQTRVLTSPPTLLISLRLAVVADECEIAVCGATHDDLVSG
jgi:hypothetical protein